MLDKQTLREELQKIAWKHYDPELSLSVEDMLDEMMPIIDQRDKELIERIGMLRQWLNEDRIDDLKKLVTNEQIKSFLIKGDVVNKD